MAKLRILFFGSPNPSRTILEALHNSENEIVGVVTQPDKRRGRGSTMICTPVKQFAQENNIKVYEPQSKSDIDDLVNSIDADIGVVVAYGKILSTKVLNAFKYGCVNVHYSLLPRWRGAAPVERALLEGDDKTGIAIMAMDEGLDTGKIYLTRTVNITDTTTTTDLFDKLGTIASELLFNVLGNIKNIVATDQIGEPTYAHKLSPNDFYFDTITASDEIDRKVRAASMLKGAWTTIDGEIFRILQAKVAKKTNGVEVGELSRDGLLYCKDGVIAVEKVQVPGKPVMEFSAWANGISVDKFPLRIAT